MPQCPKCFSGADVVRRADASWWCEACEQVVPEDDYVWMSIRLRGDIPRPS